MFATMSAVNNSPDSVAATNLSIAVDRSRAVILP